MQTIFDDDARDLILLNELKPLSRINLKNIQNSTAQCPADIKNDVLRKKEFYTVND